MTYRLLVDLDVAARKSGFDVVTIPGWKTRGRPAETGQFNPRAQVAHHTGGHGTNTRAQELAYVKGILTRGRPDLGGPLCQLSLGRQTVDGPPVIYVVAAGRANHAGLARSVGVIARGDGNAQAVGWEAINSGFEGWSDEQLDAYHRGCAAIADHYGWSRKAVYGHFETSTSGKWDPGINYKPINMNTFRAATAAVRSTKEEDMTPTQDAMLRAVYASTKAGEKGKRTDGTIIRSLKRIESNQYSLKRRIDSLEAQR